MNTKTDARETESQPLEQEQRQIRMARNIRKRCRNNRCKQVQYAVSQVFGIIEQLGCQTEQQDITESPASHKTHDKAGQSQHENQRRQTDDKKIQHVRIEHEG